MQFSLILVWQFMLFLYCFPVTWIIVLYHFILSLYLSWDFRCFSFKLHMKTVLFPDPALHSAPFNGELSLLRIEWSLPKTDMTITFMLACFWLPEFLEEKKTGKMCSHSFQKSLKTSTQIWTYLEFWLICRDLWLSGETGPLTEWWVVNGGCSWHDFRKVGICPTLSSQDYHFQLYSWYVHDFLWIGISFKNNLSLWSWQNASIVKVLWGLHMFFGMNVFFPLK